MYTLKIKPALDNTLKKLSLKDKKQMEIISRKIEEILQNPNHYKNLRAPLQRLKRVHIGKSYVLLFSVDEKTKTVTLEEYNHHDIIYRN
jgi:YafQ family addiction module toxin component